MSTQAIAIENAKTGEVTEAVYEHPFIVRLLPLGECGVAIRDGGQRTANLSCLSQLWSEDPAERSDSLAQGVCHRWLAGWRAAMAPHLHVDLHRRPAWCISATKFSAATINRSCLCRETFPACGRWYATTSSLVPSLRQKEAYNPLQKHAYTSAIVLGVLSVLTGLAIWKPVQFSWLAWMMGGFHLARLWHFLIMWAMLAFVFGHLVMVVLHGWNNFVSMLTGWKKDPEYIVEVAVARDCDDFNVAVRSNAWQKRVRWRIQLTTRRTKLIRRIRDGEHELFYELIRPYERRVYAAAFAILRNEADADDVAQEAVSEGLQAHSAVSRGGEVQYMAHPDHRQ